MPKQEKPMSRSGYDEDIYSDEDRRRADLYRGAVASAIRGRRGQAFLKEMLAAMDAMPVKTLIAGDLESSGQVCAIGSVGRARGIDMKDLDPEDTETVATTFGVSEALAREVVYMNDEWFEYMKIETPGERFDRMRAWIKDQILSD